MRAEAVGVGEHVLAAMTASETRPRLLLATRNEHKRGEFARLLEGWEVDALPDEVRAAARGREDVRRECAAQGPRGGCGHRRVSIADDSGIEAAALGGRPGVRSARYAGENASDGENLALLVSEAPAGSALEYVCALAYVNPETGEERVFEGRCKGHARRPRRAASEASAMTRRSCPTAGPRRRRWPS